MEKQFKFKLKGKTLVLIDWANVYGWFAKLKWEIDEKKLFKYLKSYPQVKDIRFYFGVEKGNKKSEEFQKQVKKIGYTLISKELKWVPVSLNSSLAKLLRKLPQIPIYRRKCDFDCEIAIDVMKNIDKFNSFILFSGDGDYAVLMKEIINSGKQAIVVALKNAMGREYSQLKRGIFICNIRKLEKFVKKIPGKKTYRA